MATENPYAPPRSAVSDVADSGELEPAGRGLRLGAYLLDILIASIMMGVPFGLVGGFSMQIDATGHVQEFPVGAILAGVAGSIVWLVLTILYVARNGQTIAKKLLDIKVVRADGSRASLGRIFWLRNVVNAILGIIPFYFLIDHLVIFGDARQCVHDKIADTIVVVA